MEMEVEDLPLVEKAFNFKKEKFCYSEEDVEFKDFTQIHIRGDSRKEPINFHESLMVFVLHEDKIYQWLDGNKKLKFIINISSGTMRPVNDSRFFIKYDVNLTQDNKESEFLLSEEIKQI